MEKDPKVISLKDDPRAAASRSDENERNEISQLLRRLENGLQIAMTDFDRKRQEERQKIQEDIRGIVQDLEKRIDQRFEELYPPQKKETSFFRTTGSVQSIGKVLRKIISVPDFDLIRRSEEVDEFGLDPDFEEQMLPLLQFFHNRYWRVDTHGLENIPNEGRALLVANHSGSLPFDGAMIKVAVLQAHPARRQVRFLVEDFVYHFPFLGMLMSRFGGVRACPENAQRLLKNDQLVNVFPEGVKGLGKLYRNRYRVQRFGRGGVIRLALRTSTPIIPTAVIGAEEIYPMIARSTLLARPMGVPYLPVTPFFPLLGPLGMIPLPSKWSIHFGEPIGYQEYGPEAASDPLLVSRLNEELRHKIQEMIKERLTKRLSIWWG